MRMAGVHCYPRLSLMSGRWCMRATGRAVAARAWYLVWPLVVVVGDAGANRVPAAAGGVESTVARGALVGGQDIISALIQVLVPRPSALKL